MGQSNEHMDLPGVYSPEDFTTGVGTLTDLTADLIDAMEAEFQAPED